MKPVDQDRFGMPNGTCATACIASLIEEPVEAIPNFNLWDGVFGHWEIAAAAWLRKKGWNMSPAWGYDFATNGKANVIREGEVLLAGGKNQNGVGHMVLWCDGELVHDPNPDRGGLRGDPEFLIAVRLECGRCRREHTLVDCPEPQVLECVASE